MKRQRTWVLILFVLLLLPNCGGSSRSPRTDVPPPPAFTPAAAPPAADAMWKEAEKAQKAGNTAAAISTWERIIQQFPNTNMAPRAFDAIGVSLLQQGQYERSLQYLDYLIYAYPRWEGINQAKVDRLRALWGLGKKKQVMKEATSIWDAAQGSPDVQVGLSAFMAGAYGSDGELDTAFDWATAGFGAAKTPEQNKLLAQVTLDLLKNADEGILRKLSGRKNTTDFMRVFLDYRLSQLEQQRGNPEVVRDRLQALLAQYPNHPIAPEIQAAFRGAPVPAQQQQQQRQLPQTQTAGLPVNADRIGCLLPLNGPFAKYGDMVMRGLAAANADWTEKHSGEKVNLVVKDVGAEVEPARQAIQDLATNDGVLAVVGPIGAQAAKAVAPLADGLGMPTLTLTQKEDEQASSGFVLHVFLDNRDMIRTLVRHCREKMGFTRFAALYPDDRYGQRLSKIFAEVVQELGGSMLASVSYKEKSTDFKEPIQKLMTISKKNAPPTGTDATPFEALFIPDQVQTLSLIAPQLPYNNIVGTTLLGTNLWGEGPLVQAGGVYVEQAIFVTPFFADSQDPQVQAFRQKYQALYNASPSYLEAQAYDALTLLLEARQSLSPASLNRTALMQNLTQMRGFHGLAGVYNFTPSGALERDYLLLQVVGGQIVPANQ